MVTCFHNNMVIIDSFFIGFLSTYKGLVLSTHNHSLRLPLRLPFGSLQGRRRGIKKVDKRPMIFSKINDILTHLHNAQYHLTYFKRISKSPFIIDAKRRIIIDLLYAYKPELIKARRKKFKSKKFQYVFFIRGQNSNSALTFLETAKLIKDEDLDVVQQEMLESGLGNESRNKFLMEKAAELNKTVPKSEVWFRAKLETEPFFQQFNFVYNEVLMGFIYDLFSKEYRVAIEVDGTWHDRPDQKARDIQKEDLIVQKNWTIIRVKANDDSSYQRCVMELKQILAKTSSARRTDKIRKKLEARMVKRHY